MNILQRIVLIIGAFALLSVLGSGWRDWQTGLVRALIVVLVVAGIYFVAGRRK